MHRHLSLQILVLATALLFGYLIWPYLTPLILAAVVAVLGRPLYNRLQKLFRNHESLSALTATATIIIVIGIPLVVLITLVTRETIDVVTWARQYVTEENLETVSENEDLLALQERLQNAGFTAAFDIEKIQQGVLSTIKTVGTKLIQHAGALIAGVARGVVGLAIFTIALFFFLRDGGKLVAYFRGSPYIENHVLEKLVARFKEVTDAIVFGNLSVAALQGIVIGIGFLVFGLPNGLLVGLVTALFALIPAVGPLIIIAPATAYLGFTAGWGIAITFAIITYMLTLLIDNLLKPILLERHLRTHSLIVFLSLIGGISAFGLLGIIYGPLITALFLTLLDLSAKEV